MLKSIFTFSFFTVISRVSGLIRDICIARVIGTTYLADIFFSAFRFANLFRAFFAEGAFTTSFIPLYSRHNDKQASDFASSVIFITCIILLLFCLIIQILLPILIKGFIPGFEQDKFYTTVTLSRIMTPYIIFISVTSLIGGILQVKNHFTSTAISPIILNISLTVSLFMPYINTPVHNLAISVLVGGILQLLLIVFSAYKLNVKFSLNFSLNDQVKLFFKRVIPATINNCAAQIIIWINTIIASFLPNAVSYIYYADRLVQLPQGVIGVAISTVLLPIISKKINEKSNIIKIQNKALIIGLIFIMPTTAAFILIPDVILLAIFNYSINFNHCAVAPVLTVFSLSLPAFVINKVLLPLFFAQGKLKIPMIFSLICLVINIMLNLLLINKYQHIAIAIATSASTWVNSILLLYYLKTYKAYQISQSLLLSIIKILISTIVMSIALYIMNSFLRSLFFDKILIRLAILIILSIIIYFTTLYLIFLRQPEVI
ncbi:murein biosynthesis integral membrane protein MurJ [Wolbachia pipientis]|uniref:Probable lipid II flippase MurJ n=1 Tax=Wolbachia pipientis TaxID=955 RepID=A0A1E7QJR4_WOLPI|nr:murein biosynthesis integral membrane protein MurJ [Wolbachia pipientis]OEY86710.1 murein biosynthesis integral membrane protein MurJ [Wolbachia pipientis]